MNDVSIKERLKNLRKNTGKTFEELLILYGIERLLYRLSISPYSQRFILKGGVLLYTLLENKARTTRDIDVLAKGIHNSKENIQHIMTSICQIETDDALTFDLNSIQISDIAEDDEYHGVRFVVTAYLGKARIHLQMDIGFSDTIYPEPRETNFPSLLNMPAPRLLSYPIETIIAEKYEAMTSLGIRNSRYKDFYDIISLSRTYNLNGTLLQNALINTFQQRHTKFSQAIYQKDYAEGKERAWQGFKNRTHSNLPLSFAEVIQKIKNFLLPIQTAIINHQQFTKYWNTKTWEEKKG